MARVILSRDFILAWSKVRSKHLQDEIDRKLSLIESMPGAGSAISNGPIRSSLGGQVLQIHVPPYAIIYERKGNDAIVYDLLYGPASR